MTLPPSDSSSFELLDERIRRWVWQQRWDSLRDVQEEAIPPILAADRDVVLSAPTSVGKTEAAFLPILTHVLAQDLPSIRVLYVAPLKALINDQFGRLELLCEHLEVPVHRWHGDVGAGHKANAIKNPGGNLLITPESLEALFMRRGTKLATVFAHLSYVVVDEVHSFIGTERGAQLRSLLHRLEEVVGKRVPRIGLSATLSEPELAGRFLRSDGRAVIVRSSAEGGLRAQLRGFLKTPEVEMSAEGQVVDHLLKTMRGHHNLVFCNRKQDVEEYADALSQACRRLKVPDEFVAHHGNLAKEIRESAENRLRSRELPVTCVCTSTLEMGIDIGAMRSVAQIGPTPSVASLRQRVGRSGRRDQASILRLLVVEEEIGPAVPAEDRLRPKLLQAAAEVELMAEGWCEPPDDRALHSSTLIQQVLSLIVQRGGASIAYLYRFLVEKGPFRAYGKADFLDLLRVMKAKDLVSQMDDGTVLLGGAGERMTEHYSFYASFSTPDEYRLMVDGKQIGTIPLSMPLKIGDPILFAGRRWQVVEVDDLRRTITLVPGKRSAPPMFGGELGRVHRRVRERMRELYMIEDVPVFMDTVAQGMLEESRFHFNSLGLAEQQVVESGTRTLLFHWSGDLEAGTLRMMLESHGLVIDPHPAALVAQASFGATVEALQKVAGESGADPFEIADQVKTKIREKNDWVLTEELLNREYASHSVDIPAAAKLAAELAATVQ